MNPAAPSAIAYLNLRFFASSGIEPVEALQESFIAAITVMLDIPQSEVDRVIKLLKNQSRVKFLWRTFGAYNITVVIICDKGSEGTCISKLRTVLEKMRVKTNKFETTISYSWEKIDFSPFQFSTSSFYLI